MSPSTASMTRFLKLGCAEDSLHEANKLPIWTPSAPKAKEAAIAFPEAIPPADISGIEIISATSGSKQKVVVSSLPLCPPASKPSATIASTPASWAFKANLLLDTTWTTVIPCSFNIEVNFFGFPADVKTIFTPSSIRILICLSISG